MTKNPTPNSDSNQNVILTNQLYSLYVQYTHLRNSQNATCDLHAATVASAVSKLFAYVLKCFKNGSTLRKTSIYKQWKHMSRRRLINVVLLNGLIKLYN